MKVCLRKTNEELEKLREQVIKLIEEIEAEYGILFKSIEFSKHDLQDFDSAGNLSDYVRELIKSIDVAYNGGKVL
jgi:hypothetical protein